jgi:hypothetical protein
MLKSMFGRESDFEQKDAEETELRHWNKKISMEKLCYLRFLLFKIERHELELALNGDRSGLVATAISCPSEILFLLQRSSHCSSGHLVCGYDFPDGSAFAGGGIYWSSVARCGVC